MHESWQSSFQLAHEVVEQLVSHQIRLVLAESCTSGLMAATLGTVAGVSQSFCGSAVTYRDATKQQWLGIDEARLEQESAVSKFATVTMAKAVLERTGEADLSVAITGHLGPDAPQDQDGLIFVAIASRRDQTTAQVEQDVAIRLNTTMRQDRQGEACLAAWRTLLDWLKSHTSDAR